MKTLYNLSKDYNMLYKCLCRGYVMAGFVDYRGFSENQKPLRDIVKIQRHGEYDIYIGARGIEYGAVRMYQDNKGTEQELFIKECEQMNLEFIDR